MRSHTDQMRRKIEIPHPPQRIISLVPSQTELLHHLGLGERVVGITKFCIHPKSWFKAKPRVGGTKKIDLEKIRGLSPDLIIGNKEENERKDILELEKEFPVWLSDVRDLNGALEMIAAIGALTNTSGKADPLVADISKAFATLRPLDPPVSVAYLIWREPFMVAGHGTFVNDMLLRCGCINVFDADDARYPTITAQELEEAAPELVLLSSEPYPFKKVHAAEIKRILPETQLLMVDGEIFSWYGSRALQAPAYFHELFAF